MKCCYCKSWSMCFDEKPYYNECKSVCPLEEKETELDNVSQDLDKDLVKNRNEELEILKIDLENIISGMTIAKVVLSAEESDYLCLFKRCKSILDRIKPAEDEETKDEAL